MFTCLLNYQQLIIMLIKYGLHDSLAFHMERDPDDVSDD